MKHTQKKTPKLNPYNIDYIDNDDFYSRKRIPIKKKRKVSDF
jgi:hypothetical protein